MVYHADGEGGLSVLLNYVSLLCVYLCCMSVLCSDFYCALYASESNKNCPLGR